MRTQIALVLAMLGCTIAPALAQHRFEARLAPAHPPRELVAAEMAWTCEGVVCAAEGPMALPAPALCQRFAREQGRLDAFLIDGAALPAEALQRCNAKAH